jgi:predicted AAA+ superfamily ATPase
MDPFSHHNLESVLINQFHRFKNSSTGIQRRVNFSQYVNHPHIIVITGVRRCGKSTLLRQLADYFPSYLYVNLDDERFAGIGIHHLTEIMTIFEEKQPGVRTIFLDEIQNIPEWERFVRRIHDDGYQVFLTGSNASLLSSELATRLSGRYVKISLWPFRFDEYCNMMGISNFPQGTQAEAENSKIIVKYLEEGVFQVF